MTAAKVRSDILKGAMWLASFKLVERGIGIASTLILVRLLLPEDFGLVAMAMSVIVAIELFTSFGFDVVLIQNQQAQPAHYHTAWTFRIGFGLISSALIAALAYPLSWFYQDERLVLIMYAIAVIHLLGSLENIAIVDFRKHMQFHKEVVYQMLIRLSGFIVTVPLALVTGSYWSLIAGMAARNLAKVVLSFGMRPMRPRLTFSKAREIFGFSAWLMLNNALFTAIARAHDFIVGRVAGAKALGLFSVSLEISNLISTELIAPINRAAFSGYAKMASDSAQFQRTYLDIMGCIMLLSIPAAIGIAATAELLVPFVLGAKWHESIPVIKVLAVYGAFYSLSTNSIYIFHALAKPRMVTRLAVYQALVLIPSMYVATVSYGLIGAAWALLGTTAVVAVPMMWTMASKALEMSIVEILKRFWRPVLASGVMYAVVRWLMPAFSEMALWLGLAAAVGIGIVVYAVVVLGLWRAVGRPDGGESLLLSMIANRLRLGVVSGRSESVSTGRP